MAHRAFNLYKRPTTKNGKYIYYVQFYDEYGNRLTARSTGQTSKAAAENWSYEQLRKGIITTDKNITFGRFAKDWWIWDICPYVKGRRARGSNISRTYIDSMRRILDVHILPYLLHYLLIRQPKLLLDDQRSKHYPCRYCRCPHSRFCKMLRILLLYLFPRNQLREAYPAIVASYSPTKR